MPSQLSIIFYEALCRTACSGSDLCPDLAHNLCSTLSIAANTYVGTGCNMVPPWDTMVINRAPYSVVLLVSVAKLLHSPRPNVILREKLTQLIANVEIRHQYLGGVKCS